MAPSQKSSYMYFTKSKKVQREPLIMAPSKNLSDMYISTPKKVQREPLIMAPFKKIQCYVHNDIQESLKGAINNGTL